MAAQIEGVILPGDLLTAKPLANRHDPLIVRVTASYRHGDAHRYNLEYYALEPGRYDLAKYLTRVDQSAELGLPPVWVEVSSTASGNNLTPATLEGTQLPWLRGYRAGWILGAAVWLGGLYLLITVGRQQRRARPIKIVQPAPTLAEQLRPLVEAAREGTLTTEQRAQLERTLIVHWCEKLQLRELPPSQVMDILKQHGEAGPLLRQLEVWLHSPEPREPTDINELLAPYASDEDGLAKNASLQSDSPSQSAPASPLSRAVEREV